MHLSKAAQTGFDRSRTLRCCYCNTGDSVRTDPVTSAAHEWVQLVLLGALCSFSAACLTMSICIRQLSELIIFLLQLCVLAQHTFGITYCKWELVLLSFAVDHTRSLCPEPQLDWGCTIQLLCADQIQI